MGFATEVSRMITAFGVNMNIYTRSVTADDAQYGDGTVSYSDAGAEKVLLADEDLFFDQTEGGPFSEDRILIYLQSSTNLGSDDRVVYGGVTYDCKLLKALKMLDGTVIAYRAEIEKVP